MATPDKRLEMMSKLAEDSEFLGFDEFTQNEIVDKMMEGVSTAPWQGLLNKVSKPNFMMSGGTGEVAGYNLLDQAKIVANTFSGATGDVVKNVVDYPWSFAKGGPMLAQEKAGARAGEQLLNTAKAGVEFATNKMGMPTLDYLKPTEEYRPETGFGDLLTPSDPYAQAYSNIASMGAAPSLSMTKIPEKAPSFVKGLFKAVNPYPAQRAIYGMETELKNIDTEKSFLPWLKREAQSLAVSPVSKEEVSVSGKIRKGNYLKSRISEHTKTQVGKYKDIKSSAVEDFGRQADELAAKAVNEYWGGLPSEVKAIKEDLSAGMEIAKSGYSGTVPIKDYKGLVDELINIGTEQGKRKISTPAIEGLKDFSRKMEGLVSVGYSEHPDDLMAFGQQLFEKIQGDKFLQKEALPLMEKFAKDHGLEEYYGQWQGFTDIAKKGRTIKKQLSQRNLSNIGKGKVAPGATQFEQEHLKGLEEGLGLGTTYVKEAQDIAKKTKDVASALDMKIDSVTHLGKERISKLNKALLDLGDKKQSLVQRSKEIAKEIYDRYTPIEKQLDIKKIGLQKEIRMQRESLADIRRNQIAASLLAGVLLGPKARYATIAVSKEMQ